MAKRRMMSKDIIDTDLFLEMPATTQNLYFYFLLKADDDGFISAPKRLMRMLNASEDDLKILLSKKYLFIFKSGVVVIKDWKIHNYIQKDRYTPTKNVEEMALLSEKENNVYSLDTECVQDVSTGKVRKELGEVSLEKEKVFNEFDLRMVNLLKDYIIRNNPIYQKKEFKFNIDNWVNDIRLMREVDNLDEGDIELLINFSQNDDFWMQNIASPKKLRKQAPKLMIKAKNTFNKNKVVDL